MKKLLGLALILPLACALPKGFAALSTPVWVTSNNHRDVDVYLLCGNRDAIWLGLVGARGDGIFEIPSAKARPCVAGLNFFLVPRAYNRGYWVGPLHLQADSRVELVIEKYAALSAARLRRDLP